ncbi:Ferritin-like superfamily [Trinorchestia longiramus]|nr:Ferritin-like superfamily [Trinorchestia longiramus]
MNNNYYLLYSASIVTHATLPTNAVTSPLLSLVIEEEAPHWLAHADMAGLPTARTQPLHRLEQGQSHLSSHKERDNYRLSRKMKFLLLLFSFIAFGVFFSNAVTLNTDVSTYLDDHAELYLKHMKAHFDNSLDYLFTGNMFADQSFERPGLGKVFREESDRHWELGIGALKKYLQRGGSTPDLTTSNRIRSSGGQSDPPAAVRQEQIFRQSFAVTGKVTFESDHKNFPNFPNTYLKALEGLVMDCKSTASALNHLHKKAMQRHEDYDNNSHYDADMAHFLEEKMEKEVEVMRKYRNLHTTLEKMKNLGLARHIFDQHL